MTAAPQSQLFYTEQNQPHHDYLDPWWKDYHFDIGQNRVWRFGSLLLKMTRKTGEWLLEYHRPKIQDEDDHVWCELPSDYDLGSSVVVQRFIFSRTTDKLTLKPRLADRSVVVKPVNPIFVSAGHQGCLYVSTPLWITAVVENQKTPLFDIPIVRLNDTWFGKDTMRGEVCYATPVFGRTQLEHLPPRPFRAVTPVVFHNRTDTQLELARLNLPVPGLPLMYSPSTKRLWTPMIEVTQESASKASRLKIDYHTPKEAEDVLLLNMPRNGDNGLFKVFEDWFD